MAGQNGVIRGGMVAARARWVERLGVVKVLNAVYGMLTSDVPWLDGGMGKAREVVGGYEYERGPLELNLVLLVFLFGFVFGGYSTTPPCPLHPALLHPKVVGHCGWGRARVWNCSVLDQTFQIFITYCALIIEFV